MANRSSTAFLAAALPPGGIFQVAFPVGVPTGSGPSSGAQIASAGAIYNQGTSFTAAYGSTITVTWIGPSTLPKGTRLSFVMPRPSSKTVFNADGSITETRGSVVTQTTFNTDGSISQASRVGTTQVVTNADGSISEYQS